MTYRIAVSSKIEDARARGHLHTLKARFPGIGLQSVAVAQLYTIDIDLSDSDITKVAERLTNPLTEHYSLTDVLAPEPFSYAIEVGFLPGVTDNLGHTARETIEDATDRKFRDDESVYSSLLLFLTGPVSQDDAEKMAQELYNPLIERVNIFNGAQKEFPVVVPKVSMHASLRADEVDLDVGDEELAKIGKEGILNKDGTRRGPLSLSLRALKTIRDHFKELGRDPTDVELESLAQTWSEHCKHMIFSDPLDEVKEGIYRRYIKGATEKIRKQKGKKDFCVSVFKDNSGAILFDDTYLITHKVETHNSPSGLDPFGGSVTAIVGVNRDALGFGLSAKPIANTYGFCVTDPHDATELFRDKEKKQPLLPARRILEGVIRGINAGGNQSGIPTPLGFVAVDPSYRGKPLVYGGTVGLIPRKIKGRKLYEKKAKPGDFVVMIGGRVGADGIHGATFSSESLSSGSPATAVQIGDPITQKKFLDAIVREARDKNLYSSITDDGAGGLSGSVGEMSKESGGCKVELEKVPLKYPGLAPWQIWLSESQERMTLAVPKKNWAALKKIFDRHDVEATRIGTFTGSGKCVVRYSGAKVMDMQLSFLHDGRPIEIQKSKMPGSTGREFIPKQDTDLGKVVLDILARPSIGSTSFISQQYDHEVQGTSVTKPIQGKGRVNSDAGVMQPLPHSPRGIVLSHGYAPWYSQADAYAMAAASIDTAIRNAICAGASRDYLAILDNFCWSSSDTPERLYELKQAAKACFDLATAYGTPFISGKDSMFNDFRGYDANGKNIHIAAQPTLLISTIGVIPDVSKAVTIDFKRVGDLIYLIGETNDELGASEYYSMLGGVGSTVPVVDFKKNAKAYDALSSAIQKDLIASAISVGRGGLAVALAKSAIAGQIGLDVNLQKLPGSAQKGNTILFSESQGRMLVSVRRSVQKEFEKMFKGVALTHVGEVIQDHSVAINLPDTKVELPLSALTQSYRSFFREW
jgi:phosphoribosylformylglycinamidine synthase II